MRTEEANTAKRFINIASDEMIFQIMKMKSVGKLSCRWSLSPIHVKSL